MRSSLLAAALLIASAPPLHAQPAPPAASVQPLQRQVEAILAKAPPGTRWGLLVTTADGREVVAINPDQRFIPASNTKLFTTAAALAELPQMIPGTRVRLDPGAKGRRDVVLIGRGDPGLSSAADCVQNCLSQLADAVAKETRSVRNIIGDATLFPDQRWSPGMSWNNIGTDSGTAISALSLDNNELPIVVTPSVPGQPPAIAVSPYVTLINEAQTIAAGKRELNFESKVNGRVLRVYGRIPVGEAYRDRLGIDDPAHYAAWTLQRMLAERGVKVRGEAVSRYSPVRVDDGPEQRAPLSAYLRPDDLAAITPTQLLDDIAIVNKVSQNLHAEMLLRQVGLTSGAGSLRNGAAAIEAIMNSAGVPRTGYDFSDGSGMSTYNRVSPRAAVGLLRWGASRQWGRQWRDTMPIGGVDGTLKRRFVGTPLQGKLWAKTGTLNATNALSGWLTAASGEELTFSIFANDVPDGANAVPVMDEAILAIAAAR